MAGGRVGIMGGTFDPIHHGHLVAASEVGGLFGLDEVVFVPTGQPWQKTRARRQSARGPLPHDGDRDRVQSALLGQPCGHRPRRSDVHDRHPPRPAPTASRRRTVLHHRRRRARPDRRLAGQRADVRSGALHRRDPPRLPPGRLPSAGGQGQPGRGPRPGDQFHRLPWPRGPGHAGLVPRARRRGAVHREARAVPEHPSPGRPRRRPRDRDGAGRHAGGARPTSDRPPSPPMATATTPTPRRTSRRYPDDRLGRGAGHRAARRTGGCGQARHRRVDRRRQRPAGDHRCLRARLGAQRAAGAGDRGRGRGAPAPARHQAGPPGGRRRVPVGPARLRRRGGARAARRGARVLRARAAVEGLPDDPVRRQLPVRRGGRCVPRPRRRRPAGDRRRPAASRAARAEARAVAARADGVERHGPVPGAARPAVGRGGPGRGRPLGAPPGRSTATRGHRRRVQRPQPRRGHGVGTHRRARRPAGAGPAAARARDGLLGGAHPRRGRRAVSRPVRRWITGRPVEGRGGEDPGGRRRAGARRRRRPA